MFYPNMSISVTQLRKFGITMRTFEGFDAKMNRSNMNTLKKEIFEFVILHNIFLSFLNSPIVKILNSFMYSPVSLFSGIYVTEKSDNCH